MQEATLRARSSRTYILVATAVMSTIAIVMDLLPLPRVIWGMKIDLVGAIWVLTFFLYGWKPALTVSSITAIYIAMFSDTGYVGALMKFIATIPMFLVPAAMISLPFFGKKESRVFERIIVITAATILATVTRLFLATAVNLYWAIPIWWGMTPEQTLATFGGIVPLIAFVASLNVVQGIVDILASWALAFKLRLSQHFGTW
jgi:riboflavin transporter FmnP